MGIYLQGLLMGLAYVAPIGMQNMFIINNSINKSTKIILITVFSVIVNDISLAITCFLGFGFIINMFPNAKIFIGIIGFLAILMISINTWKSKPKEKSSTADIKPIRVFFTAFAVTWLNPQAIIDGTLILGSMHSSLTNSEHIPFILGFSSASLIWFISLSFIIKKSAKFISPSKQMFINKVSALILLFFGIRLVLSIL